MAKYILSFVFLFVVQSHAQSTTANTEVRTKPAYKPANLSEEFSNRFGMGVSLLPLSAKVRVKSVEGSGSSSESSTGMGIEAQFVNKLQGSWGVKGAVGYIKSEFNDTDLTTTVFKGSGLFALSNELSLEGGLNISNTKAEDESLRAGIGFQLGLNYLLNKNAIANISYVSMNSSKTFSGVDGMGPYSLKVDLELSGLQAGVSYLF